MGKSKAPAPDKRIGQAAMMSAEVGRDYLAHMQEQAAITNEWAQEDRDRHQSTFLPLEDQFIERAQTWDSEERMDARVNQARTGVAEQISLAGDQMERQNAAMGVDPSSGRAQATGTAASIMGGLASANAGNLERRAVTTEAEAMRANAINLGSGLAVNPATSMGLSNSASSSGFNGAMSGYGQQGQLLNTQFQQQMQSHNANQASSASFWNGVGSLAGLAFASDEDIKENKKLPRRSLLEAANNMRVEEWDYKEGEGDGKRHVGTYAQDFKKQTGMGDGKSIDVIDMMGTTLGAIQELSDKVEALEAKPKKAKPTKAKRREIA